MGKVSEISQLLNSFINLVKEEAANAGVEQSSLIDVSSLPEESQQKIGNSFQSSMSAIEDIVNQ